MRPVHFLLSAVTAAAALVALTNPVNAASVNYVALGDSYASGVGTGSYDGASGSCKRSPLAYPALWAASHAVASFTSVACGGAKTTDVIASQAPVLSPSTTLVTVQVGGNDAGFIEVVATCTFLIPDKDCVKRVDRSKAFVQKTLPAQLDKVYDTIKAKSPSARVVVMGYPRIYKVPGSCIGGLSDVKRSTINSGADALNVAIAERAAAHGFTFVDVRTAFSGREICSQNAWLNGFIFQLDDSFHPNRAGHQSGFLPALRSVIG